MSIRNTISSTEARQKFAEILENVEKTGANYTFTVNGRAKAVLMSAEDYESWAETNDILSDPKLVTDIKQGQDDIKAGRVRSYKEIFGETPAETLKKQVDGRRNHS